MGKGVDLIGKALEVAETGIPSLVFGVLEVISEALAAPMVVALWAQLLVVVDMRTGQQVTTYKKSSSV